METLESSRVCRLCGKHSGISIYIFDKNESHVKKINAVLPIMVHEMDLLPKHMCHWCSYKLEEFYKFYANCLKTDTSLKGQLSWMGKEDPQRRVGTPMVHIENIKLEPPDYVAFDMTPMVGDANYMSSAKSMAFEPDDIPYAAYRCRCCCDKMDQSNRTESAAYQNTAVSRCSRLSNAIDRWTDSRPVKTNPVSTSNQPTSQERPDPFKLAKRSDNRQKQTGQSRAKNAIVEQENVQDAIVHNLRPRNVAAKYATTRKKAATLPQLRVAISKFETPEAKAPIKVERLQDLAGRTLRPRRAPIDYIGPKRKYKKSADRNQRSNDAEPSLDEHKVRNIASKLTLSPERATTEDRIGFGVKQEQLPELEDPLNESTVTLPKNETSNSFADTRGALPPDNVQAQNDRVGCSLLNPVSSDFSDVNRRRAFRSPNRPVSATPCAPMCLRSHSVCLRNGKKRRLDRLGVVSSPGKLHRSRCNMPDPGKSNERHLLKTIGGLIGARNVAASIKLIDNIKRYCDECNTSFVSRELFKLHLCYH